MVKWIFHIIVIIIMHSIDLTYVEDMMVVLNQRKKAFYLQIQSQSCIVNDMYIEVKNINTILFWYGRD